MKFPVVALFPLGVTPVHAQESSTPEPKSENVVQVLAIGGD
ncbi:MAG TPA: hypothetical protein VI895_11020 [Bdellovibrionota bacterium]|nr:hypothetical protein [Bdellovibrionota bacterium]